MSTLKVGAIRGVSAVSDAITIANDGTADANLTSIAGAQLSNRNLLMNGEMIVAQRSTAAVTNSAAGSTLVYETIDRWGYWANAASVFSIQQVDDSPVGFSKSLKFTSAGARSIVSADYYMVGQGLEGGDIQHLNWGTANAKDCVLSFHVKSSLTGTFTGYLHGDDDFKPSYVFTYTILQANTWEKKDITITAPGTGQSGDFGSAGSVVKALEVGFNLGVGTTYATTTINAWHEGFFKIGTTTSVDVVATNGATWQVTGVQMEINDSGKPTEYEHRPFQQELLLCQRYFQNVNGGVGCAQGSAQINGVLYYRPMRTDPTLTKAGTTFQFGDMVGTGVASSGTPSFFKNNGLRGHSCYSLSGFSPSMTAHRPMRDEGTGGDASFNLSADL
tara:strand:+ start:2697 stop:3863 length:1167 start_codon:yes stop_codon:yes gene_type:complete